MARRHSKEDVTEVRRAVLWVDGRFKNRERYITRTGRTIDRVFLTTKTCTGSAASWKRVGVTPITKASTMRAQEESEQYSLKTRPPSATPASRPLETRVGAPRVSFGRFVAQRAARDLRATDGATRGYSRTYARGLRSTVSSTRAGSK